MAKDKKSFLMYADYIDVFEGLNDKEAGRLIKHILRYVNDLNPETKDRIVALTFEPIKKQMKRDLRKYETVVVAKSEAGKLGNLKRWNPELYKQVIDRKISLSDALRQNESQKVANIAVTDNDTVNVNDTVINNNNVEANKNADEVGRINPQQGESNSTQEKQATPKTPEQKSLSGSQTKPVQSSGVKIYKQDYTSLMTELQSDVTWLTSVCVKCEIPTVEQAKKRVKDWIIHFRTQGEDHISLKEAKRWCSNWLASKQKPEQKTVTANAGAYQKFTPDDR